MPLKKEQKYRSWVEVDLDNFIGNLKEIKRLRNEIQRADCYNPHGAEKINKRRQKWTKKT